MSDLVPRALGLDFGTRRIGVAVTDALGMMAHPVTTIPNDGPKRVRARVQALCEEKDAALIVVGIPVNMDGTHGPAAQAAERFAARLEAIGLPVERIDERLTTVDAEDRLKQAGHRDWRARKSRIDEAAAALILESWLDARRRRERGT